MWRSRTPVALVLAAALLAPASAGAAPSDDFARVYAAFQRAGTVDGCAFSARRLAAAREGVPPDVDTYAPGFPAALDAALSRRAAGGCDRAASGAPDGGPTGSTGATGATPADPAAGAPGTTPAPAPEPSAAPDAADGSVADAARRDPAATRTDGLPLPLVLLVVLAALAGLLALAWALVRSLAVDPPWLQRGRHATAEAGWRASAWWAEFTDWVRFGR